MRWTWYRIERAIDDEDIDFMREVALSDHPNKRTCILRVLLEGKLEIAKLFIEDITHGDWGHVVPIQFARHPWTAEWLVRETGADVNVKDRGLRTPLHRAASNNNLAMIKWLVLKGGAKIDPSNYDWERTPIEEAECHDNQEVIKWFKDHVTNRFILLLYWYSKNPLAAKGEIRHTPKDIIRKLHSFLVTN